MQTDAAKRDTRQGIQSVEIGARLLEAFASANSAITLGALAAKAGMSSSKAHRYLISLLRCGLVHQDPVSGRYDLGQSAVRLGLSALGRLDAVRFANDAIIELNQRHDVMAILTVWASKGPTVISLYNRSELLLANLSIGAVLPILRSASGRVFLAYLPRSATRIGVDAELRTSADFSPPSAIRDMEDVEKLILQVRRQRYGMTRGDLVPGRRAVAAPIFDHQGVVVSVAAVIGIPEPSDGHIEELLRTAEGVSKRLGFREGDLPFVEREHDAQSSDLSFVPSSGSVNSRRRRTAAE